jgi:hypothetical protein
MKGEKTIIKNINYGEIIPIFYLPLRHLDVKRQIECAFFLVAPFILAFHIIRNIWRCIWYDLCNFNRLLVDEGYKKNHRRLF